MFEIDKEKMVGFQMKTVHNLLKRDFQSSIINEKYPYVTGMQRWIIGFLYRNKDKDIFQRDLEEEFSIRRSTATGILQLMEKNELIIRQPVSHDARLKKLVLTPMAIEIQKMIIEEITENEIKLRKGISEDDLEVFFKVLKQIKNNLED